MSDAHYDLIVIGSGPGGGSLAQRVAATGKRILIIERGDYLPRSELNWSAQAVFVDAIYQADETWTNAKGDSFSPALHYYVGGNSKVYGAALFRLRERDFGEVVHAGGLSPAWPLGYDVFEPYYTQAETLFQVHGQRGEDPLEPWASGPYPHPPVSHEPKIAELSEHLRGIGLNPFHLPLGILLDEKDGKTTPTSMCPGSAPMYRAVASIRCMSRAKDAKKSIRPTSWWWPAAHCRLRCCCCAPRTMPIRTAWPTDRIKSGATTCGTT